MTASEPLTEWPTLDEVHITIEQFEDEAMYLPDGTVFIRSLDIWHRCPPGTGCWAYTTDYCPTDASQDARPVPE